MDKKILYAIGGIVLIIAASTGAYLYLRQNGSDSRSRTDSLPENPKPTQTGSETSGDTIAQQPNSTTYTTKKGAVITITQPARGSKVTSPLTVSGVIPSAWSSGGRFTLRVIGPNNNVLVNNSVNISGNGTADLNASFTSTVSLDTSAGGKGSIVLMEAGSSGLPEDDDSVVIPIEF